MRPRPCRNWVRLGDNMPLTEQEREWLERRKNLCERCFYGEDGRPNFCGRWRDGKCIDFDPESCLSENVDYKDAAEFEARVAERLAKPRKELRPKGCSWYEKSADGHLVRKTACPPHHDIDNCPGVTTCAIYHARLAAEAEIDNTAGER